MFLLSNTPPKCLAFYVNSRDTCTALLIQRKDAPRVSKFISSLENGGLAVKSSFFSM
jgi:hypothetical protein